MSVIYFVRRVLLLSVALAMPAFAAEHSATLYKDPNCGCCEEYVKYLEHNGYQITAINSANMLAVKQKYATDQVASCHTMLIDGYVVEGHVPVAAIEKMLSEKPAIKGIALPGMPFNSPGMGPEKKGSLDVLQIDKNGKPNGLFINL